MTDREKLRDEIIKSFDARLAKFDELNDLISKHHFKHYDVRKRELIDVTEGRIKTFEKDVEYYRLFLLDSPKVYSIAGEKLINNREYNDDFCFLEYNGKNELINFFGFNGVFVSSKLGEILREILMKYVRDYSLNHFMNKEVVYHD